MKCVISGTEQSNVNLQLLAAFTKQILMLAPKVSGCHRIHRVLQASQFICEQFIGRGLRLEQPL